MKLLICFAIYLQVPEGQVSPSSCAGHGIWLKHIGQECEPAILGAPHPCSSTKHIPASKNLLWAFSPPSYCLCRPALVCRNNREALWALNTQHCCFALSNLSIGFSNSIFFMRTDWTILAYVSGKFALHMTVNSASEFAALEGKFYSISNQLLIQQSYYFQVGYCKDQ